MKKSRVINIDKQHKFKNFKAHNLIITFLVIFFNFQILFLLNTCSQKQTPAEEKITEKNSLEGNELQEVSVIRIQYSEFTKEIISNGKLSAVRKSDLRFRTSENITEILVKNGDRVQKGQKIAKLDQFTLQNSQKQALDQFEQAKLELQDILISQGYNIKDTSSIPPATLKTSLIKSGYNIALENLETANYNLNASILRAPFNGIVANLFLKENNLTNLNNIFCTIIDDKQFEAEFFILESEINSVRPDQFVSIIPFHSNSQIVKGKISYINPFIDANGIIKAYAICNNTSQNLVEGMNVKVIIEEKVPHQIVIPKQAVVLRNERQVVFTVKGNKAKWNYIKTDLENSTSYTISEGLTENDSIIYEGTLYLAHDTEIRIKK